MQTFFPLTYWWLGIVSFLSLFLIHILWWQLRPIHQHLKPLVVIFFGGAIFHFLAAGMMGLLSWNELALPLVTHLVLSAHYISIYPIFQASSPTIDILEFVSLSPEGVSLEEITQFFESRGIIDRRFGDLVSGKLIRRDGETTSLTLKGQMLAGLFIWYRKLLGLPIGEG